MNFLLPGRSVRSMSSSLQTTTCQEIIVGFTPIPQSRGRIKSFQMASNAAPANESMVCNALRITSISMLSDGMWMSLTV